MANQDKFNYYILLGVPQNATTEEIIKQYRKLSLITHPDKVGGYDKLFILIKEAKDTLLDPYKRSNYDRHINNNEAFSNSNPNSENILNERIKNLILENEKLKEEILKMKNENTSISNENKWLKTSIDNKSDYIATLAERIENLNTKRKSDLSAQNQIKSDQIEGISRTNRVLKETIQRLESENQSLKDQITTLEERSTELSTKKLTGSGCALILIAVLFFIYGLIWYSIKPHYMVISFIIGTALFIVGLRRK